MIEVKANGDVENGIRMLRRLLKRDDIHAAIKFRSSYIKPSEKKAAKERRARTRKAKHEKRVKMAMERHNGRNQGFTHAGRPVR
jgi:ribosomal protein S21